MAERIVSPGVFTRETDISFLPQGIAEIGAAIIGPTVKGPAFVPTLIRNFSEFEEMFGSTDKRFYTPYAVREYLRSAGTVTVVRVLHIGGYEVDYINLEYKNDGDTNFQSSFNGKVAATLAPSAKSNSGISDIGFTGVGLSSAASASSEFVLTVSGSNVAAETYTLSFDTSSANYIENVISRDPLNQDSSVYLLASFKNSHVVHKDQLAAQTESALPSLSSSYIVTGSGTLDFKSGTQSYDTYGSANTWTGNSSYSNARTPYILSQRIGGTAKNLFRVYTRNHGAEMNQQFRIEISQIKAAGSILGSDYGSFALQVKKYNPDQFDDNVTLEEFDNLNFDPTSPQYFARVIGDRYVEIDANGKLTYYGDYPNKSKYIRVGDYTDQGSNGSALNSLAKSVVPMGFGKVFNPVPGTTNVPSASFVTTQVNSVTGQYQAAKAYGFDFSNFDSREYLNPIPKDAGNGNNVTFSLEDQLGSAEAAAALDGTSSDATESITLTASHIRQRKFQVPFQFGFDGNNPALVPYVGAEITSANSSGFDLSSSTASGSVAYKRALNAISNADEFDINMLVTPGVISRLHSNVTNHAITKVEERADTFYVMDSAAWGDTISTVTGEVEKFDTNYAATYYPWVKIVDLNTNLPTWVPPSVVLPGVISFTDKVAHEWFAPAGLNRGGLTSVTEAKTRLTHEERDDLYEGRVNPIATFPGQGVCVWGQKTLQAKPSALDRVNVRRLLIRLKKFISSSSRFLVFEQNTISTRNRFLNIVNPFLESVQANSGLSAFRVVMDDTNNTPDVVDRNRLVGQIFIQPTRTAEFIVLDFIVQPTGASFPE